MRELKETIFASIAISQSTLNEYIIQTIQRKSIFQFEDYGLKYSDV